jgi:hypothetical protein
VIAGSGQKANGNAAAEGPAGALTSSFSCTDTGAPV